MPKATCRCGQRLSFPTDAPERVVCPSCGARIRVRRDAPSPGASAVPGAGDGFIRFGCPCGRRLKVKANASSPVQSGKCPDCGRIVPVPGPNSGSGSTSNPSLPARHPEARTDELSPEDVRMLEEWSRRRLPPAPAVAEGPRAPAEARSEAGLRVCPRCGRPVHMNAVACRECGAHVPKR